MDELYKIVHKTLVLRRFSILLKNHGDSDLYGPSWWLNQPIWTKYAKVNLDHFPTFRDENLKKKTEFKGWKLKMMGETQGRNLGTTSGEACHVKLRGDHMQHTT